MGFFSPLRKTAEGWKWNLCLANQRPHLLRRLCPQERLLLLGTEPQTGTGKGQIKPLWKDQGRAPAHMGA